MQNNLENIVRVPKQHICNSCIKRHVVTFSYTFTYKYILHQLIYYFLKIWIAIFGVKARKADSGTMRMKRSLLVKVGEALAPDAFQLVLDSESDTKGRGHNSHTPRYPYRKENHTHQCIFFYIISVSYRICLFSFWFNVCTAPIYLHCNIFLKDSNMCFAFWVLLRAWKLWM